MCENVSPAAIMRPSLALEHFKHRYVIRAQGIALDFLQPHGR